MIPKDCPPELKGYSSIAARAAELETVEPVISYWCGYHIVERAIQNPGRSTETDSYLSTLLDALDNLKRTHDVSEIHDRAEGERKMKIFALRVFDNADRESRALKATSQTAQKFLASVAFMDACEVFGPLSEEMKSKRKYAKIQAVRIKSGLMTGKDINAPRNVVVEDVPDEGDVIEDERGQADENEED